MKIRIFLASQQRAILVSVILVLSVWFAGLRLRQLNPADYSSIQPLPLCPDPALDLNACTADQLRELPGIGPTYARRIVAYRQRLGGYHRVDQLEKVYGLNQALVQELSEKICADSLDVPARKSRKTIRRASRQKKSYRQLDLNTADAQELIGLPGIGEKLSKRIVSYRKLIGFFYKKEQLHFVYGLSETNYQRMQPYLRVKLPEPHARKSLRKSRAYQLSWYQGISKPCAIQLKKILKEKGERADWELLSGLPCLENEQIEALKVYFHL